MAFHLDIPESITSSLRLPASEIESCLRTELAVALYAQGILSFEGLRALGIVSL